MQYKFFQGVIDDQLPARKVYEIDLGDVGVGAQQRDNLTQVNLLDGLAYHLDVCLLQHALHISLADCDALILRMGHG